jgi:hypothetical protein
MSDRLEGTALSRRTLVVGAGGALASAAVARSLAWPTAGGAAVSRASRGGVAPAPTPIPGGFQIPGLGTLHVFAPGPTDVTLPFTGLTLGGLDVEASSITDFKGSSAVAFMVGSATGSDGKTYNLETDIRAFEGEYVVGGESHRGAFAFV